MTTSSAHRRGGAKATSNGRAVVRCAIYTRQSVFDDEEGEFGSLAAQRESCAHYIAARRPDGWQEIPTSYEDAGFSGGTMTRPALTRLLADIEAGLIDCVVVYKLDRLSRSLRDFGRVRDLLEAHDCGLASVTQSIDSKTATGQLMLNVLMSFAEHERKTTAERVTDKIRASRKRGLWTGGRPPLGYDSVDGKLVVNEPEAERVREMYRVLNSTRSLAAVLAEVNERGWRGKTWTNKRGEATGGGRLDAQILRTLLKTPLYAGCIRAGDEIVDAQHEAIVDRATWDAAQAILTTRPRKPHRPTGALLGGLLRCGVCGAGMTYHYAQRHGKRYGSYVCESIIRFGAKSCPGSRVAAGDIEGFLVGQIRALGSNREVREATLAAARSQASQRQDSGDLDRRRQALATKQARLVAAIEKGGDGAALAKRLADVEAELRDVTARADAMRRETTPPVDDEHAVRAALASFAGIWGALANHEQARALQLLVEQVRYDAGQGRVEIDYADAAIRLLGMEAE